MSNPRSQLLVLVAVIAVTGALVLPVAAGEDIAGAKQKYKEGFALFEAESYPAALVAFDLYVQYRERVSTLRINELKRNIPWVVTRTNRAEVEREPG